MIKTEIIALAADTPWTFPDSYTGKNLINGDSNITVSDVRKFDECTVSFETAGTVNVEFDYGLGFNELFAQTQQNDDYKATAVQKLQLESIGQTNNIVLTFTKPIGGV